MIDLNKVKSASATTDSVYDMLSQYRNQFAGIEWMPANLFDTPRILHINNYVDRVYRDLEGVGFDGLPNHAYLTKNLYQMWMEIRLSRRWMHKDHTRYITHVSQALQSAKNIIESLRNLTATGRIPRPR